MNRETRCPAEEQWLFGKPADWEDGGLVSQRITSPELELRLLSYQKGGVGAADCRKLLVPESFFPAPVHVDLVTVFL